MYVFARLLLLTVCLVVLLLSGTAYAAPERFDAYQVALHLQNCEKRPVFFVLSVAGNLSTDVLPPCDKNALEAWLAARELQLVWEKDVILIKSAHIAYPIATWQDWSNLKLDVSLRAPTPEELPKSVDSDSEYKFIPIRRALSADELHAAGEWLLRNAPMPPVNLPAYCPSCGDPSHTAIIRLQIILENVRLSREGPERVVGYVVADQFSRIVVGEMRKGKFLLDWASPLLNAAGEVLIYRDVNADGIGEIWSLSERRNAGDDVWLLSIFSLQGRELTRDAGDCDWSATSAVPSSPLSAACPIIGFPAIDHFLGKNGTVFLEAARDFRGGPQPRRIYEFSSDRYVLATPH